MKSKHPDRSHVGMGVHVCPVCLKEHDEVVLIDKYLRPTLNNQNFMGWVMCPEHEARWQEGYIALIECANESPPTLQNVKRTGEIAHVQKEAWPLLFNVPTPDTPFAFVQQGVIERLQALMPKDDAAGGNPT